MNDEFEERAAIIEFLGNVTRDEAEHMARVQLGMQSTSTLSDVDDASDFE